MQPECEEMLDPSDQIMQLKESVSRTHYEKFLAGERSNFSLVNAKVKQLGQIPVLGKTYRFYVHAYTYV